MVNLTKSSSHETKLIVKVKDINFNDKNVCLLQGFNWSYFISLSMVYHFINEVLKEYKVIYKQVTIH